MDQTVTRGALALLLLGGCVRPADRATATYDRILRGGWIVDGSGNPRWRGDVALTGERIAAVGFLRGAQARETLDVSGLIVAPGFIDMLGQSETNVLIDNRALSKITQGITTEVTGEGSSVAPLTDALVALDSEFMKKYHLSEDWRDLDGYFAHLARTGSAINIATFVGATQVRAAVVGFQNRRATAANVASLRFTVPGNLACRKSFRRLRHVVSVNKRLNVRYESKKGLALVVET